MASPCRTPGLQLDFLTIKARKRLVNQSLIIPAMEFIWSEGHSLVFAKQSGATHPTDRCGLVGLLKALVD